MVNHWCYLRRQVVKQNGSITQMLEALQTHTIPAKRLFLGWLMVFLCMGATAQEDNDLLSHIYALHDEVSDPSKQVGNLNPDSVPSLPIGIVKVIGGTKYIIAIDSAEFTPQGAFFNAYMALEFPGSDQRLAFAAKHIQFNPQGVLGGSQAKLALVSEHNISVGPNTLLHLPDDGSNYVEWDCNGFKSANIRGDFQFSKGILVAKTNTPYDSNAVVKADFQVHVTDIHNILAQVSFTPFHIRGMKKFTFTVNEAYVDMSDFVNPIGMVIPPGYVEAQSSTWRGFYLKNMTVELPPELSKRDEVTSIFANHMVIDDAGVTGEFGATNLFSTTENDMHGWGFSIDELSVKLVANQVTGGGLDGEILVPPLDNNPLKYEANITKNPTTEEMDYHFLVKPESNVSMNCFKADLEIYNSSTLQVFKINNEFKPLLTLNGKINVDDGSLKLNQVNFEQLTLITEQPYITQGLFSLVSSDTSQNNLSKYPLSISQLSLGIMNGNVGIGANVALNLSSPNDNNCISASTSIQVLSKTQSAPSNNGQPEQIYWSFDQLVVNQIALAVTTEPVELNGVIDFHRDHIDYGDGFMGSANIKVNKVMDDPITMSCAFGNVNGMRYWMVDAAVPVNIQCGALTLTSLRGGVANRMSGQKPQSQIIQEIASGTGLGSSSQVYLPDANAGFSFKAGVGAKMTGNEKSFNGDVILAVNFNSSGGLSDISLIGDGYMMVKRDERMNASKYVRGTVSVLYDNVAKVFDAQLSGQVQFSNAITGTVWSQVYIDTTEWHVFMGTPSLQATVNVANLASANAYLMMGQNLEPMPPPPPQVMAIFNNAGLSSQRDESAIASGDGVATGLNFNVSFNKNITFGNNDQYSIYGMGSVGAGFDMTMYNYGPNAHCSGSTEPIGLNSWYLNGQLYAYLYLNIGITGRLVGNDFDVSLLNGNAALLLQGKLPKPTYVYGAVALNAQVLGVLNVNVNFDFDFGNNCTIIQ